MIYITREAFAAMRDIAYILGERDFSEQGVDRISRAPLIGLSIDPKLQASFSRLSLAGETFSDTILRAAASYQKQVC